MVAPRRTPRNRARAAGHLCALQPLLDLLDLPDLPDRQAAEAVRCRINFTYTVGLELDDPGFHHSVLGDLRDRIAQDDRADRALDVAV